MLMILPVRVPCGSRGSFSLHDYLDPERPQLVPEITAMRDALNDSGASNRETPGRLSVQKPPDSFRMGPSKLNQEENPVATSAEWHEDYSKMSELTLNFSRAVKSLQEELEAVDWYNQRAQATKDEQLRRILEHNRNEEVEHAMMTLEYLRRVSPVFEKHMRTYLFTEGDIVGIEKEAEGD